MQDYLEEMLELSLLNEPAEDAYIDAEMSYAEQAIDECCSL